MFKRSRMGVAVALAVGSLASASVLAQEAQRVEITGSSIRRVDAETASPVQIITKDQIDQSGKGTVAEYLQTLTADGQGSVPFTYGRGFSGGTSAGISLRGLGSNATLVLINGRRAAPAVLADDAQRSYVDLNQIPMEAVERVEVLKDGASSIYGSDAVAGVVNIILKKNFVGTVMKATYGMSGYSDGKEPRVALTHGFGDIAKDGFNVLLNLEAGQKDPIWLRDRTGRGPVGVSAIGQAPWGFDPNAGPTNNIPRSGGNGWIPTAANAAGRTNNSAVQSFIGNVRNPVTNDYYSRGDAAGVGFTRFFPAAQTYCNTNANLPQNNLAGGCLQDVRQQFTPIQPEQKTLSFYGRLSKQVNADTEGFLEVGYYKADTNVVGIPLTASAGINTPSGVVISRAATTLLGASHPDNPYFGTAARLAYQGSFDFGPTAVDSSSSSVRVAAGLKGTVASWDYDTALNYSEVKQTDISRGSFDYRTMEALLNPTAANVSRAAAFNPKYAALPADTFWRIGENAGLNSAATRDALFSDQNRDGFSRTYGADIKVSREFGKLDGGPIGVAFGAEARHEANNLPFYTGLGNYAGLSLTRYGGDRNIYATYGEVLLPVIKRLELTAALRYDKYSDAGTALTPKVGAKFKALDNLAFRSTYSEGFRAPSSSENSPNATFAFGGPSIDDNARCTALIAGGMTVAAANAICKGISPAFVGSGNPALKNEKSKSMTLGLVWDVTSKTSVSLDYYEIKRSGLPVTSDAQTAIDNGFLIRDPATAVNAKDPGAIVQGFAPFVNSAASLTRGIDVDFKHRWDLGGGMGLVTAGLTWSHLMTQRVIDLDGTIHDYAGTHGNCDITNCIGSPRDRISLAGTWQLAQLRLGTNINYRGSMSNKLEASDTTCAQSTANGADFPAGCKVGSFTTVDVSAGYKIGKNTEVFGSIANLFDAKPPADFETYGAIGYNPLDYSGAIGRFFKIGLKHKF